MFIFIGEIEEFVLEEGVFIIFGRFICMFLKFFDLFMEGVVIILFRFFFMFFFLLLLFELL